MHLILPAGAACDYSKRQLCPHRLRHCPTEHQCAHSVVDSSLGSLQERFLLSSLPKPCTRREAKTAKETLWATQLKTQAGTCRRSFLTGDPSRMTMFASRSLTVAFATLIFTRSRMSGAHPTTPWFLGKRKSNVLRKKACRKHPDNIQDNWTRACISRISR